MEAGEKELRQVFEDVTTNNVKATVAHSNETRKMMRVLEEKVILLEGILRQYDEKIEDLRKLLVNVQMKLYSGELNK